MDLTLDELVDPRQAALVVIDMQNDFCDSRGALARSGADPGLIQAMAPRLRRLLGAARQAGLPIVHVRTEHSPWTDSAAWLGRMHGRAAEVCRPGTWGADFYPGFEPRSEPARQPGCDEYVVTKHRYSGFVGTDLDLVLRARRVRSLILTGEATNVCVESTARDAFMCDYRVAFVSDCTAAARQAAHEATLETIARHFGTLVTADEVLRAWQSLDSGGSGGLDSGGSGGAGRSGASDGPDGSGGAAADGHRRRPLAERHGQLTP
jgi:ureidoacrylate peracid hydrolase